MNLQECEKFLDGRNAKGIKVFVYYTYTSPETGKERNDEMNLWEWVRLQRKDDKKNYKFVRLIDLSESSRDQEVFQQNQSEILPVIEDELECPLCGMVADSDESLIKHKQQIHDQAPPQEYISESAGEDGRGEDEERTNPKKTRKRKANNSRGVSNRKHGRSSKSR